MAGGPFDYGSLLASGRQLVPDWAADELRRRAIGVQEQQLGLQVEKERRTQQRATDFQSAFEEAVTKPGAQSYAALISRFPEFGQEIKQAWDMQDEGQKRGALTRLGSIHEALKSGNTELAIKNVRAEIQADIAANGVADENDTELLKMLESGDETQIAQAAGLAKVALYSVLDKQTYARVLEEETKAGIEGGKPYTLAPGSIRFDALGNVISSAPFAPRAVTLGPGQTAVEYVPGGGGGGGGTGGATTTGGGVRRSGGLTPRSRDGGDNSDSTVTNKLGVIAKRTGFDPDAEIGSDQIPALVDAYIQTEGGAKSRGGRVNNPGNIIDGGWAQSQPGYAGSDGRFAKFVSPEAGRAAVAQLIGQKLRNGFRTVRDIIEGKPVDGGGTATAAAGGGGGGRVIGKGAPKPPTATRVLNGKIYEKHNGKWYERRAG